MTVATATPTDQQELSGWTFDTAEDRLTSDIIACASDRSQMVREARKALEAYLGMWTTADDTPEKSPHCTGNAHDTEYLIMDLERTCYLFAARIGPPLKKRLRHVVGRFDLEEVENAIYEMHSRTGPADDWSKALFEAAGLADDYVEIPGHPDEEAN